MTITVKDLPGILEAHHLWMLDEGGKRACLRGADLRGAYLQGAYLQRADLRVADLQGADLQGADLKGANLQGADLRGADLRGAYLRAADLQGADLRGAYLQRAYLRAADLQGADLRAADLQGADLRGAYLQRADLQGANLQGAYLQRADLRGAYLRAADLQGADLRGANLQGANGVKTEKVQPLLMLLDQVGKIRAYKLVTADGYSPMQGTLHYPLKAVVEVKNANTDPGNLCAAGVNVATLDWCLREWRPGWRIMVVEFTAKDIACIPTASDGKFRLHRCKVVGEKDLVKLGLIEEEEETK